MAGYDDECKKRFWNAEVLADLLTGFVHDSCVAELDL